MQNPQSTDDDDLPQNPNSDDLAISISKSTDEFSSSITGPTSSLSLNNINTDSSADLTSQLEELTKIVSPKVSELLSEQALALDAFMGGLDDSDDYDDDDDAYNSYTINYRNKDDNTAAVKRRHKKKQQQISSSLDDSDGMDDEWRRLEGAQNDLRNELALAAGLSAFMMNDAEEDYDEDENDDGGQDGTAGDNSQKDNDDTQRQTITHNNKPYTLADHAKAMGVVRPSSERGLYSKPLLSRHDLLTLDIVTLPDGYDWMMITKQRSNSTNHNNVNHLDSLPSLHSTPETRSNSSNSNHTLQSDAILQQIQSYTTEYIEPPKTKTLRKLFAGWNPGPGERRIDDGRQEGVNRITDYSSTNNNNNNNDDDDESSTEEAPEYVDVDGVPYPTQTTIKREPTPLRTITIRIRPDVLCGSVMGSITDTVERLGGDTVKRQGGHLRAVLPGKTVRVYKPGEWEREMMTTTTTRQRQQQAVDDGFVQEGDEDEQVVIQGEGPLTPIQRVESHGGSSEGSGDASIASGITSLLFSSPRQQQQQSRSKKGPKYINLPPYLIDAQLVTKKLGKTCHRLLLVRVYRIQDCVGVDDEEEEEILDVPVPLDGEIVDSSTTHDLELECERSIRSLREAAALIQRIKAVGGRGFAIQPSSSSKHSVDESDNVTVASHSSTKSYLKSFGDVITSPIRYLSSPTPPTYTGQSRGYYRGKEASASELMSKELLGKCRSSPSVGMASTSAFNAAKLKSHGVFPSLSREDSPYVKASWVFLRECIKDFDQRCLSYR